MNLAGKRVLVTGGAGFIGSHIIDQLVGLDCAQIIAIDNMVRGRPANLAQAILNAEVQCIEGDIRDQSLMADLVADTDVVFHQAALRITQCADEPRAALETMVLATFSLLELCVEHRIEKIVAASTASVYGMATAFPTAEDHHPYDNRTLYGAAKVFNEGLLRSFHDMYGLNYVALRYFNAYGTRMDIHGAYTEVLIRWIERIAAGQPPLIFGDGQQTMDFIEVRDIARCNIAAMGCDVADEVFNVASGTETSLVDLAQRLLRIMGSDLAPQHVAARHINPVPRRLADTNKAKAVLDFSAAVGLDAGLEALVHWWHQQQTVQ